MQFAKVSNNGDVLQYSKETLFFMCTFFLFLHIVLYVNKNMNLMLINK